ncbi:MAG: hypothetical protein K9H16_08435 [Bacteroidales bacterium]|nr:hypothetical protein [Bacteroidales bacterium]
MKKLSDIWLKATVVGSLWATIEIILGSFFHNLRVPFAGTILAMISVGILVAFHRHWKQKGLFWRAGLICALMKSISPSAILLGPMTGIFTEALLMELFVRLLGGNLAGYIIGGAFALMSTIAHKIINLLLIYGFDIVTVLVNLYKYASEQIGYPELKPGFALSALFAVYAILGFISAIVGFAIGKKRENSQPLSQPKLGTQDYQPEGFFKLKQNQHFSVRLLFFHLFALIVCLVMIRYSIIYGSLFIAAYVFFSVFHYRQSLKHLKRPFFWVQVILLTFLATIFYNGFQKGDVFDQEGLVAGLQMNIRAVLILVGFSSVSVELRNPVIKNLLMKKGLSQLYLSLGLAFSVLPWIIKNVPKPGQIIHAPGRSITGILDNADRLLNLFQEIIALPKVIILAGERHEGKTTFASELARCLSGQAKRVGGFIAPGKFENYRRSSFNVLDLETGISKPLCSIHFTKGEKTGPFRFDAEGLKFGHILLDPEHLKNKDFVVIDEIGPLELKGEGWTPSIDKLMTVSEFTFIWVVRKSLVHKIISRWNLVDVEVIDITLHNPDQLAQSLLE